MELMLLTDSIPYRKQFHSAKKDANESVIDWYHRLMKLSEPCNYGAYLEVVMLDQLVIGLDDTMLTRLCSIKDNLSITNIIDLVRNYEFEKAQIDVKPYLAMIKQEETISDIQECESYSTDGDNDRIDTDDHNDVDQPEFSIPAAQSNKSEALSPHSENIKSFECYLCHKTVRTLGHLTYHFILHHTSENCMKCRFCGKWVKEAYNMIRHLDMHLNAKPHRCNMCDFSCAILVTLNRHMRKHNESNVKTFNCTKCDKTFILKRHLRDHKKTHDEPTISLSEKLDQMVKKRKSMESNSETNVTTSTTAKFNCEICSKTFENESSYDDHMKLHCESEFLCHLCGKKLRNKRNLICHYRIHEGDKPFKCDHCHKSFGIIDKLKLHSKIHNDVRPHVCSICNRSYIQKGHLVKHMQSHNVKEKKFKCQQCPRGFTNQRKFDMHLLFHSGYKAFECRFCDKSFKFSWHRTDHERVHTGERPYKCKYCNLRFAHRGSLSGHHKWHAKPEKTPAKKGRKKKTENI